MIVRDAGRPCAAECSRARMCVGFRRTKGAAMNSRSNKGVDQRATTRWMLAAAVAGLAMAAWGAPGALAQGRVNNGNALDANNRVGSGGSNDGAGGNRAGFTGVTGNDIVTGNVTGGKGFHGTINYTDPRAFRGNTGSS